ncbi:MAG: hypothetical protein AAFV53_08875 [Myxococcota bacterium]
MEEVTSQNACCLIIGARHPAAALIGDGDLDGVLNCLHHAKDDIPGSDYLLWLGRPELHIEDECTEREITFHNLSLTNEKNELRSQEDISQCFTILKQELENCNNARLFVLLTAPLTYRNNEWWLIATKRARRHEAEIYRLTSLLQSAVPFSATRTVSIVILPYRQWGMPSYRFSSSLDCPQARDINNIVSTLREEHERGSSLRIRVHSLEGWRPDKGDEQIRLIAEDSFQVSPLLEELSTIFEPIGRSDKGFVLFVYGGSDEESTQARVLQSFLEVLKTPISIISPGAASHTFRQAPNIVIVTRLSLLGDSWLYELLHQGFPDEITKPFLQLGILNKQGEPYSITGNHLPERPGLLVQVARGTAGGPTRGPVRAGGCR